MRIEKIIETKITLVEPEIIATSEDGLLLLLKNRFNGTCMNKCKIINVLEIVKKSQCVVCDRWCEAVFAINVIFKADVLIYCIGEVIPNALIIKKSDGMLIAETEYAKISMPTAKTLFNEGMMLPLRISAAYYNPYSSSVAVHAEFHTPAKYMYFKTSEGKYLPVALEINTNNITDFAQLTELTAPTIQKIRKELELLSEIKSANPIGYETIKSNIYPLASEDQKQSAGKKQKSAKIDFDKLVAEKQKESEKKYGSAISVTTLIDKISKGENIGNITGYILRDNTVALDSDVFFVAKENNPGYFILSDSNSPAHAILYAIERYLTDLVLLREMYTTYSERSVYEKHKLLWKVYDRIKE